MGRILRRDPARVKFWTVVGQVVGLGLLLAFIGPWLLVALSTHPALAGMASLAMLPPTVLRWVAAAWRRLMEAMGLATNPLQALRDPVLRQFIRDQLVHNYTEVQAFFPQDAFPPDIAAQHVSVEQKISLLVERILTELERVRRSPSKAARRINKRVVVFEDPDGAFRRAEQANRDQYFAAHKASEQAYMDSWYVGPTFADIGAGGYGRFLQKLAARAPPGQFTRLIATDTRDFSRHYAALGSGIEFVRQPSERIPVARIGAGSVTTARLAFVIHHTYPSHQDPRNPESRRKVMEFLTDLQTLLAPGGRVVIYEDSYPERPSPAYEPAPQIRASLLPDWTARYLSLSPEQKYHYLVWNDWYWNVLYGGSYRMSMAYRYYTMEEWAALFREAGFRIVEQQYWGFRRTYYHGGSHAFFVLEKPAPTVAGRDLASDGQIREGTGGSVAEGRRPSDDLGRTLGGVRRAMEAVSRAP